MREVRTDPEPIVTDGRRTAEITADIFELMQHGYDRNEIRLFAGQPSDWDGDRWRPGLRYCGVLVI